MTVMHAAAMSGPALQGGVHVLSGRLAEVPLCRSLSAAESDPGNTARRQRFRLPLSLSYHDGYSIN
jgi:hypothetical protein